MGIVKKLGCIYSTMQKGTTTATSFLVHDCLNTAVKKVDSVNDRTSHLNLQGW